MAFFCETVRSTPAFSDTSASTPSSSVTLDQFDKYCQGPLSGSSSQAFDTQVVSYCQAAQSSLSAAKADDAIWKAWVAVAAICTAACAFGGTPILPNLCIAGDAAVQVTQGVLTNQLSSAFMSLMTTVGMAVMMRGMGSDDKSASGNSAKKDTPEGTDKSKPSSGSSSSTAADTAGKPEAQTAVENKAQGGAEKVGEKSGEKSGGRDAGSCLMALYAGYEVYSTYASVGTDRSSALTSLQSAASELSTLSAGTITPSLPVSADQTTTAAKTNTTGGNASGSPTLSDSNGNVTGAIVANACADTSTAQAIVQCATASSSNLPSDVASSSLPAAFNQATNGNLGNLLSNSTNPTASLGAAMNAALGSSLTPQQSSQLQAVLGGLEHSVYQDSSALQYSGGRGGSAPSQASGGGEDSIADMMASMMGQLTGGKGTGGNQPASGLELVIFANKQRSPAAVAEDRSLSIFDRVTFRYYYVNKRMLP